MTNLDGHRRFALGATVRGTGRHASSRSASRASPGWRTRRPWPKSRSSSIDAFQGQGVGRTLLKRLAAAALARGILRFRGIVLPENRPIIRLLTRYAPDPAILQSGEHLRIDVDLASGPQAPRRDRRARRTAMRGARTRELPRTPARRARTGVTCTGAHAGGPFNSTVFPSGSVM